MSEKPADFRSSAASSAGRRAIGGSMWVLFESPKGEIPEGDIILSFLPPADEERFSSHPALLRGRECAQSQKKEAIAIYRNLVAQLGCVQDASGKTLRRAMTSAGESSLWWFHPVALRNSESDPTFDQIVQTLAIRAAATENAIKTLCLVGVSEGMAEILRTTFTVEEQQRKKHQPLWKLLGYGFASRSKLLARMLWQMTALRRSYRLPTAPFSVAFVGFWDWSFQRDRKTGGFSDRYLKRLPQSLRENGVTAQCYFAWFDPYMEPSQQGRPMKAILAPLSATDDVVILQALLSVTDVLRALVDFRPLWAYLRMSQDGDQTPDSSDDHLAWTPILRQQLMLGCLNAQIPYCQLVALASQRAAHRYRPALTLSFLEHFPHARAHYEGMRRSGVRAENWAVQHAGACREKTFYYLHPRIEFAGEPDGVRVPTPDRVFAMGNLGREVFLECGYDTARVERTGSTRYDHIVLPAAQEQRLRPLDSEGHLHILLACSLELNSEISMVEAVSLAAGSMQNVRIRLRNHPSSRVDSHPRYKNCTATIEISSGSLKEDLEWSDLVIYSYSTVAEEAFILGKPVWQWLPLGFNGSALAEVARIPQYGAVTSLKTAISNLLCQLPPEIPTVDQRRQVAEDLFGPADGGAAGRIAAKMAKYLERKGELPAGVTN